MCLIGCCHLLVYLLGLYVLLKVHLLVTACVFQSPLTELPVCHRQRRVLGFPLLRARLPQPLRFKLQTQSVYPGAFGWS